jgi:secondary thiamine-phosphate synthase enzyme
MSVKSRQIQVTLKGNTHIHNVTKDIQAAVSSSGLKAGTITIFIKHTTASVMIIEDEPGIREDTQLLWDRLIPPDPSLQHNTRNPGEDNGHSHLRGQLQGPSITIPFLDGALTLGTWQEVVIVDFDTRSRSRDIILQLLGE